MNQFILNIMKVYCTASVIYIIYSFYLNFTKAETVEDIIKDTDILEKYNKIKKRRIMVFIFGILVGLAIIVVYDSDSVSLSDKISQSFTNIKSIVEDVSDISVI